MRRTCCRPSSISSRRSSLRADALAGRITIATLSVWAPLSDLGHADVEVEAARWPALAGLLSRLAGQPALARVLEEDRALLASF